MSRRKRRRRLGWGRPLLACAAVLAAVYGYRTLESRPRGRAAPARPGAEAGLGVRAASLREPPRVVYPHSILPGGAWSRAELAAALYRDPAAARHYQGFQVASARLDHLDRPRAAYVSYRVGDAVYWTRRAIPLPAGEAVLSDGRNLARARCGNRISFEPRQPRGPEVDLDTPEPAPPSGSSAGAAAPIDVFGLPLLVHDLFPPAIPETGITGEAGSPVPGFGFATRGGFAPLPIHGGVSAPPGELPAPPLVPAPVQPTWNGPLFIWASLTPLPGTGAGGTPSGAPGGTPGGAPGGRPGTGPRGFSPPTMPPGDSPPSTPTGGSGGTTGGDTPPGPGSPPGGPGSPANPPAPPGLPPLVTPPGTPPEIDTGVPEPATALLIGTGALILAIWRKMR